MIKSVNKKPNILLFSLVGLLSGISVYIVDLLIPSSNALFYSNGIFGLYLGLFIYFFVSKESFFRSILIAIFSVVSYVLAFVITTMVGIYIGFFTFGSNADLSSLSSIFFIVTGFLLAFFLSLGFRWLYCSMSFLEIIGVSFLGGALSYICLLIPSVHFQFLGGAGSDPHAYGLLFFSVIWQTGIATIFGFFILHEERIKAFRKGFFYLFS